MNTKKPRFCRRCGIELHDFGPNQRLCDDCRLILRSRPIGKPASVRSCG